MQQLITIVLSPFEPPVAIAFDLTIGAMPPYSSEQVSIVINPNIVQHEAEGQPSPGVQTAQVMETVPTNTSGAYVLDFKQNNEQLFPHNGKNYTIKLMRAYKQERDGQEFFAFEILITQSDPLPIQFNGGITFRLRGPTPDWSTDANSYTFPPFQQGPIAVLAAKHPDKTIQIEVAGPFGYRFSTRSQIPPVDEKGLSVAASWEDSTVSIYLNTQLVAKLNCGSANEMT